MTGHIESTVVVPLYEYQCKKCRRRFEKIQKFSDPPVTTCPKCGGPVEQLLSAPAVQFKGTGWYVSDYGRKSGASPGDGGSSEGGEKKAAEKAETPKKSGSSKSPEK